MQEDVPLVVPEVNAEHLKLVHAQSLAAGQSAALSSPTPNCSAIGLVMALAPLQQRFGLEKVFVVTMQAVSGAGYPGVASLDILGNVIPYIAKEEEKMEEETRKMLGRAERPRASSPRRVRHERAVQPRGGGGRAHRIGVGELEEGGAGGGR